MGSDIARLGCQVSALVLTVPCTAGELGGKRERGAASVFFLKLQSQRVGIQSVYCFALG